MGLIVNFRQHDPDIDRPITAMVNDYPASYELAWHSHVRGQILYASSGVVALSTPDGAWVAPPERAVWTPGGIPHSVRMVGAVHAYNLSIAQGVCPALGDRCRVIGVSPLLRSLMQSASDLSPAYELHGRDGLLMELLVAELERAPMIPLAVPFPTDAALAAKCQTFLERPSPHDTIDGWSDDLGMGRRAFTRAFRRATGMSFAQWRQQACLLIALPRLAAGDPVTAVALDLGYDSPAAFATMFKRVLGIPPSRYQSTHAA